MSHFLERLASSVTKPADTTARPALRPLIGSIYAPVASGAGGRNAPSEIENLESSVSHSGADTAQGRTSDFTLHAESDSSRATASSVESTVARSSEILLPQASSQVETRKPEPAAAVSAPAFMARTEDRDSALHENSAASRNLSAVIDLLMGPSQKETRAPAHSLLEHSQGGKSRAASGDAARRAPAPAHESDEITIHIGRIEVAAVHQPAARPAPAPARKAMSLDEYLKRGNGRAR